MKKIKILVTGLCLSRNRGGPAMALSFMNQIKRHLAAEFTFAVAAEYLDLEKEWGKRYGVRVVGRDSVWNWLIAQSPFRIVRRIKHFLKGKKAETYDNTKFWRSTHKKYQREFLKADCVVNLNGIAFVGDGTRSWMHAFGERTCSIYSNKHDKPFFRFIQSYGPFKMWSVKFLAMIEFRKLPCVMARGKLSANSCKEVAGTVPVHNFPDIAITLPCANELWLNRYLDKIGLKQNTYIVLSPSAVVTSMRSKSNSSVGAKHVSVYAKIARHYLSVGERILFIPHMTSPTLSQCDKEICNNVIDVLRREGTDTNHCHLVDDELDCRELKSLIGAAKLAILSRYHALVAALSSGVPAVALGWNDKYEDLLDFYESSGFVVDARQGEPDAIANEAIKMANRWSEEQIKLMRKQQSKLAEMVTIAGKICADWIIDVTNDKERIDMGQI
jgi:polysaccharide pyruvyl transferase WcaK-like protein